MKRGHEAAQGHTAVAARHDEVTRVGNGARLVEDVIASLNPVLIGWANYFRTAASYAERFAMDEYPREPIHSMALAERRSTSSGPS